MDEVLNARKRYLQVINKKETNQNFLAYMVNVAKAQVNWTILCYRTISSILHIILCFSFIKQWDKNCFHQGAAEKISLKREETELPEVETQKSETLEQEMTIWRRNSIFIYTNYLLKYIKVQYNEPVFQNISVEQSF